MNSFSLPAEQTGVPEAGLSLCAALTLEVARPMFRDAEMWLYRHRTIAMLRRYLRISIEVGRLPSLLGRELFRSTVTSYNMSSFEDGVIFVHDVEHALEQLSEFGQRLVANNCVSGLHAGRSGGSAALRAADSLPGVSGGGGPDQRTFFGWRSAEPAAIRACGKFLSRGGKRRFSRK